MKKYTVTLASRGNPDFGQDPRRPLWGVPNKKIKAATLREARDACLAYITKYGIGVGSWYGGLVCEGSNTVAQVSFNGRLWQHGIFPSQEIVIEKGGDQ